MITKIYKTIGLLALFGSSVCTAEDFTEGMIARWTFNDSGANQLVDDLNGFELTAKSLPGYDLPDLTAEGAVQLEAGQWLFCREINSKAYPEIQSSGVTLWARMRFDNRGDGHTAFPLGLMSKTTPGDWRNMSLTVVSRPVEGEPALSFFGTIGSERTDFGAGNRSLVPPIGEFFDLAVVFDEDTETMSLYLDGEVIFVRKPYIDPISDFTSLGLGQLMSAGAIEMTVDEVRVYSFPVGEDWLGEIGAVGQ
ncbi:LamG domain-containing protein [Puniceicoccus vermicola]|uniref:LamG domain-containing protein n=1 Tax=Puniceicoccus vermicola TaxID=388746 RepID=A0A7X1AZM3_9BACT|nr:hypothetical protein [Puniceicoccus vermicola]MBC2602905.1 hypothetical protein [Puniceicoccus vermicola]